MIGALTTAAEGLSTARAGFGRAASDVVRAANQAVSAYQQTAEAARPGAGALPAQRPLSAGVPEPPALETALVSMIEAEAAYTASARVFEAAGEMADALLDIEI